MEASPRRIIVAILLVVAACLALFFGGSVIGTVVEPWLAQKPPLLGWKQGLSGIPIGLLGAGLLWLGILLLWRKQDSPAPTSARRVIGFGLLYPGAAQVYGGRWLLSVVFLTGPLVASLCLSLLWASSAAIAQFLPLNLRGPLYSLLSHFCCIHLGVLFSIFWVASILEGCRWAKTVGSSDPLVGTPGGKAVVAGLGVISCTYLLLASLMIAVEEDYAPEIGEAIQRKTAVWARPPSAAAGFDSCPRAKISRLNRRARDWKAKGLNNEAQAFAKEALSLMQGACPWESQPITMVSTMPFAQSAAAGTVKWDKDECEALFPEQGIFLTSQALGMWRPGDGNHRRIITQRCRALFYALAQDWPKALDDINFVVSLDTGDANSYNSRAMIHEAKGDKDLAFRDYDKVIRLCPRFTTALMERGIIFEERGQWDKAIADFRRALETDTGKSCRPCTLINLGLTYGRMGDLDRALAAYDESIALDPGRANAFLGRAWVRLIRFQLKDSLVDAERAIAVASEWAEGYRVRGSVYWVQRRFDLAKSDCTRALMLEPSNGPALALRAMLDLREKRYAEAMNGCESIISAMPKEGFGYSCRGMVYSARSEAAPALRDFDKALAMDPRDDGAHGSRAVVLMGRGRFAEALQDCEKSLSFDKDYYPTRYVCRAMIYLRQGKPSRALSELGVAFKLDPGEPSTHATMAAVLFEQGLFDEAMQHFRKAVSIEPWDGISVLGMALCALKEGDEAAARANWKKAVSIDPDVAHGPDWYARRGYPAPPRFRQAYARLFRLVGASR